MVRGRGKESGGEGIQSPFEIRTYCIDRIAREWNSMDEGPGLVRTHLPVAELDSPPNSLSGVSKLSMRYMSRDKVSHRNAGTAA